MDLGKTLHHLDDIPPNPMLRRFSDHNEKIMDPEYVGEGLEGIAFKFKHQNYDLCLKLVKRECKPLAAPFYPLVPTN